MGGPLLGSREVRFFVVGLVHLFAILAKKDLLRRAATAYKPIPFFWIQGLLAGTAFEFASFYGGGFEFINTGSCEQSIKHAGGE